jgi:predicted acetyltransferase
MSGFSVRPVQGDEELGELGEIEGWSFGFPPSEARRWFDSAGVENLRAAHAAGRMLGGLILIPMGQWFGGKSVPMTGVAGVAVRPEARGRGVALELMKQALAEMRAARVALSTLYPATISLYRLVGYECAGSRFKISARPKELPAPERSLELRALTESDLAPSEQMYRTIAAESAGMLDRAAYIWRRVRTPHGLATKGFVVQSGEGAEGYGYAAQKTHRVGEYDIVLTDAVALNRRAVRRILGYAADHRTLAQSIVWHGGPDDPLVGALPEAAYEMTLAHQWMTRIVDVERALGTRGYPEELSLELDFEVSDDLLPENSGRWRLSLERGRAEVTRGGSGSLRVGIAGLAPLFSGFSSPRSLRRAGMLEADERTLSRAAATFAGPAPAMSEMF